MTAQTYKKSIIVRMSVALVSIVLLGTGTMLISYWLSERAEHDSLAVNIAGSLRMQSYRLGFMVTDGRTDTGEWNAAEQKLEATWNHPVFSPFLLNKPHIEKLFSSASENWRQQLHPLLIEARTGAVPGDLLRDALQQHITLLDELVHAIQLDAEHKVRSFRLLQVVALFATLLVSALIMYALKTEVEQPLNRLTAMARRIATGDYSYRLMVSSDDELGMLARTFNTMSRSIESSYETLEQQVNTKTRELQQSNNALRYLYETAESIIARSPQRMDYDKIVQHLAQVAGIDNIELCLIADGGDRPYLQALSASEADAELCRKQNCSKCLYSRGLLEIESDQAIYRFQISRHNRHYGVIVCRLQAEQRLSPWQQQLIQSTTDQLAIGLSLKVDEDQSHRLAVLQERTAIARELHDSLAQALSYLKIQVTRLNKAINLEDKRTMENVAEELGEGLNTAYRQLRELLTTFRLKIDGDGLKSAIESSFEQLRSQTNMQISLRVSLNIPLTPNEEVHLLQIIREASQNAVQHSEGTSLTVQLQENEDRSVTVRIRDNGKGIPTAPEKLNHYGLIIMRERTRHLGGSISINNCEPHGTEVSFDFVPQVIKTRTTSGMITAVNHEM